MDFKSKHEYLRYVIKEYIKDNGLRPGSKLPTEYEFQQQYDVSRHTVRLALSNLENERIIYKEQGLGSFVADPSSKKKLKEIGVITTYISDYIFPYIIRGIETEISKSGYSMILMSTNNDRDLEKKAVQMMLERNVDGLIVEPTKSAYYNHNIGMYLKLKEYGIPTIMINAKYDEIDISSVMTDDYHSGFIAVKELVDNHHTNIGGIFKIDDRQGKERLKGYMAACYEFGIEYNSDNIIVYETETMQSTMHNEVNAMIKEARVTGIVCYNDKIANDLLDIIFENGYSIPKDFSIVSHDNSYISSLRTSLISSVEHPKDELGKKAAQLIIDSIENGADISEDYIFDTHLVRRTSVRKLED